VVSLALARMEQTKKFVLVDPRFVRPTMHDKALSLLDTEISNILNSDVSDEIKAKSYYSTLVRFKTLSAPPKPERVLPPPPPPAAPPVPVVPAVSFKAISPPKRPHKRVRVETVPSVDPSLRRRTQRTPTKKKFGPQWLSFSDAPLKRKKSLRAWIDE
jgi:hypothetical protein